MDITTKDNIVGAIDTMCDDSTYTIIKHKNEKDKVQTPYTLMGNGKTSRKTGLTSLDVLEVCEELNKSEIALFRYFRDKFIINSKHKEHEPNVVNTALDTELTKYLKTSLMKNYAHMEYLGIIKRIRRGVYMLNPYLAIPSDHNTEMISKWDMLTEGDTDDSE